MKRHCLRSASLVLAAVIAGADRCPSQIRPDKEFERIRSESLSSDRAARFLEHLCDRIGPRLTGGAGHALAVEWVAAQVVDAGLAVRTEQYEIPHSWQPGPVRLRIVAPIVRTLAAVAAPWTPAIDGELRLQVSIATTDRNGGVDRKGAVLVDPNLLPLRARTRHPLPTAGAVLIDSSRPRALLASGNATFAGPFEPSALPTLFVTHEDAALMRRLLAAGDAIEIEVGGGGTVGGATSVGEVIAEIPGENVDPDAPARSDHIVLALTGLDSAELGTGATMNGAGVAVLVESARILHELGRAPKRTIRFAFVAGTVQGAGSGDYARRHAAELGRHRFAFALEGGAGRVRGLAMDGVQSDLERFEGFFAPVRDLGATDVGFRGPRTNLSRALAAAGVRAFTFVQEAPEFGLIDGTAADTFDKVPLHDLQESVCVVATALWSAANEDG